MGWIHLGVQVRLRKGGGTRKINIKKDATKKDMIKEGIQLFFPHGESPKEPDLYLIPVPRFKVGIILKRLLLMYFHYQYFTFISPLKKK